MGGGEGRGDEAAYVRLADVSRGWEGRAEGTERPRSRPLPLLRLPPHPQSFGFLGDLKAGVPRTAYLGVVSVRHRGCRKLLVPAEMMASSGGSSSRRA